MFVLAEQLRLRRRLASGHRREPDRLAGRYQPRIPWGDHVFHHDLVSWFHCRHAVVGHHDQVHVVVQPACCEAVEQPADRHVNRADRRLHLG